MKINKKQNKAMWIGIVILGIVLLLNGNIDDPKKEGIGDTFTLLLGGAVIVFGLTTTFATGGMGAPVGVPIILIGSVIAAPGLIGNVTDIFKPSPSIPVWAYGAGFFVLIIMVIGRKGK